MYKKHLGIGKYLGKEVYPLSTGIFSFRDTQASLVWGQTPATAVISATELKKLGISKDGVYWLSPGGAPAPFQAYIDFSTPNGPWVHFGTAVGGTQGLWSLPSTWYERTTNSGTHLEPYNTSASSFNARAFMHIGSENVMAKEGTTGWVQVTGNGNRSLRDSYSRFVRPYAWPSQPSYADYLTITARSPGLASTSILYGTDWSVGSAGTNYWYMYAFDGNGDTSAMLTTAKNGSGALGASEEADIGFGANEQGPAEGGTPQAPAQLVGGAFDLGSNGTTATGWQGVAFSLWIKN